MFGEKNTPREINAKAQEAAEVAKKLQYFEANLILENMPLDPISL